MTRRTAKRFSGLSKSVVVHSIRGRARHTTVLKAGRQAERMREMAERRAAELQALPAEDQEAVGRMYEDQGMAVDYEKPVPGPSTTPDSDKESDDDDDLGDEFADLTHQMSGWRQLDTRDRRDRIKVQTDQWGVQMTRLVNAYLDYRSRDSGDGFPSVEEPAEENEESMQYPSGTIIDVELVDLFTRRKRTLVARPEHLFPNENLIYHGYLGCSPICPSIAISLRTLSAFQQAHHAYPWSSIRAQCKALCRLHDVPYRPYFSTQFSFAYDAYLEILNRVGKGVTVHPCDRSLPHTSS